MFGNGLFNWFSSSKQESAPATWDATTATVQNQQPTSPDAPSTERVVSEQPVCGHIHLYTFFLSLIMFLL